jgi:hypothetical protein
MYYIELNSLTEFQWGATKFTLPSKMLRFNEFEESVVFFLDNNRIVGVKFSQAGGINHFYIAWEFQPIDGNGKVRQINSMTRKTYNGKEVVSCFVSSYMTVHLLDPDNGEILHEFPMK